MKYLKKFEKNQFNVGDYVKIKQNDESFNFCIFEIIKVANEYVLKENYYVKNLKMKNCDDPVNKFWILGDNLRKLTRYEKTELDIYLTSKKYNL